MYGATIGKTSIFGIDASTNQACAVGVVNKNILNEFLYYFLISERNKFIEKAIGGAQLNISQRIIKAHPFKYPSYKLQEKIVKEIDSQFSIIENLEQTINSGIKKSELLRLSILKKAFEGKLVCQDPKDDSASTLIKRINVEKREYFEKQKQQEKKPKKTKKMSEKLSIEEVLKTSEKPMLAKDVWQKSMHKENIEAFYKELKDIQSNIKEVKKGTESLLSLAK